MNFLIITHVNHIHKDNQYFGYGPYIGEMNIWLKYVNKVTIVAPLKNGNILPIDLSYQCDNIDFKNVPDFSFTSLKSRIISIFKLPIIFWNIYMAMKKADHIHLRCPGNMGLVACFVQILFPKKIKTAKYAGNWDPNSQQPWTYRLQKYLLKNTFLTKNMTVLIYGDWKNQSKNIKSFFTATYSDSEKEIIDKSNTNLFFKFLFVGSLVDGKRPLYAIKLIEGLIKKGYNVTLDLYGDGVKRNSLENYIQTNNLEKYIFLKGNQNRETLKKAYKENHFVVLPSKSEGWPKAIAEGMFWGCVPIATKVSCVASMLDFGNRGIMLEMNLEKDLNEISQIIENEGVFTNKSKLAAIWSQKYTTDIFEKEIKALLQV
ncbi:glycosyltransferase [Flavobacterium sp. SH_e]|uniref:glycosyltransferase n=1 Tax=Flavobacterium TaxID=237 RepID=UPI0021E4FD68|nr:glycosyltransferase [Flavobacterium sp. SH_e]MCV2484031.1 glycosyltransferase [Flavobacterium sp. SH_e]